MWGKRGKKGRRLEGLLTQKYSTKTHLGKKSWRKHTQELLSGKGGGIGRERYSKSPDEKIAEGKKKKCLNGSYLRGLMLRKKKGGTTSEGRKEKKNMGMIGGGGGEERIGTKRAPKGDRFHVGEEGWKQVESRVDTPSTKKILGGKVPGRDMCGRTREERGFSRGGGYAIFELSRILVWSLRETKTMNNMVGGGKKTKTKKNKNFLVEAQGRGGQVSRGLL